ncbi:hypothetical protein SAY86_030610 [Trapa natans]|uniref:Protein DETOXIFICATION n=1 Tax=Trapa natans TaxID=22666 RepID=A0AAN7M5F0_TRANT|nr:hypothetical protein SAY86_030610 [Trapa natans]
MESLQGLFSRTGKIPLSVMFKDARNVLKKDELGIEIAKIAIPATLTLAADPIASLIDTAFIGHIGHVELAAVGVAIAIFNQISKITIFPLVSITTSFVAEEDTIERCSIKSQENGIAVNREMDMELLEMEPLMKNVKTDSPNQSLSTRSSHKRATNLDGRRHIPSASSALVIGSILGLSQTLILIVTARPILGYMGVNSDSQMLKPAEQYLMVRSLGAPAVLLSLAMQGVFRGLKDTKVPLYATVVGDALNIMLDSVCIFTLQMGVTGAAIAHVTSQYVISLVLLWKLIGQVNLLPPSMKHLKFERFFKSGFLLLIRVIAVTFCVTLAASLAARRGTTSMAAFQVCLQIWLASSLLADGLAVAGQAILASAFAEEDYSKATATASRVMQLGLVLGFILLAMLAAVLHFASQLFTKDVEVLKLIDVGIPFVALTQPLNALAFVFDGINNGASDFAYSAYSMVTVAIVTISCLFMLSSSHGFMGIWIVLSIYMSLRALAGFLRIGTGMGPWKFLRAQ